MTAYVPPPPFRAADDDGAGASPGMRSAAPADAPPGIAAAEGAVETIDTAEALAAWGKKWRELEDASGNVLPFLTHEWVETWWKYLREDRPTVSDSLFIRAFRNASGELIAIAPLMRTERPAFGPMRVRALQFVGPDGYVTETSGVLCKPEMEGAAYGALLAHLREDPVTWDWILWRGLRPDGPSGDCAERAGGLRWLAATPSYVLALAPTWEEFRARLPRNMKESLRKCYNSPKRDGIRFSLEVAREASTLGPALEEFFRLHTARARLHGTVRHKDFFQNPRARRFLVEVCTALSRRHATRVYSLKLGERTIATRIGFVLGGSLYLYYSGYDPVFRRYSVMTTTVAEAIRVAIAEGLRTVNLSIGNDVSKTRWAPQQLSFAEAVQISSTSRARIAFWIYRHARSGSSLPAVRALASRYLWRRSG